MNGFHDEREDDDDDEYYQLLKFYREHTDLIDILKTLPLRKHDEFITSCTELLIASFVQCDINNIMKYWTLHGPSNLNRNILINNNLSQVILKNETITQQIVLLFEIFIFQPFDFSIDSNYIEFFGEYPSLRVEILSLSKNTRNLINKIKLVNHFVPFFKRKNKKIESTTLSGFNANHLLEKTLERKFILYSFFWSIFEFNLTPCDNEILFKIRQEIGFFLYDAIEIFMGRHISKIASHSNVAILREIQTKTRNFKELYSYLLKKINTLF
jgi:hypothetical protein